MNYQTDSIRNIRTIKATRGESLTIDLGKEFVGTLKAYMKKSPESPTFRSFDIIENNSKLFLSKEKTSNYIDIDGQTVLELVKGKWYFDVEQIEDDLKPEEVKTIYRGTIFFHEDITKDGGVELLDLSGQGSSPITWHELVTEWTITPFKVTDIPAGAVYNYDGDFRLIPSPYDATLDAFYTDFSDPILLGFIVKRG